MKLKKGFISHTIQNTQVMVATGAASGTFNGLARSNETAAFIINCLKQETTEADIVKKITDTYEVDQDKALNDVRKTIDQLQKIGAIEC
jgi:S-methylmethionine-dependent homocysteine/selenocysteine methylase